MKVKTVKFKKAVEAAMKGKYIRINGPEMWRTDCDWLTFKSHLIKTEHYFYTATTWPSSTLAEVSIEDMNRNWEIATPEIEAQINFNNAAAPILFNNAVEELTEIARIIGLEATVHTSSERYDNVITLTLDTEIIEVRITIAGDKPHWLPWYYVQECQVGYDSTKHQYYALEEHSINTIYDLTKFIKDRIKKPKDLSSQQKMKETA